MCSMISWKGNQQPLFAVIYDTTQSSISSHQSESMPLLGKVGARVSELSFEMNHNVKSIEHLKENRLPYVEDGASRKHGSDSGSHVV